jgi:predicted RNase H-like HicB family nuclease
VVGKRYVAPVEVEELEEGGFLAICPEIPGCHAEGSSAAEAIYNLEDVARVLLEFQLEEGLGFPENLREVSPGAAELRAEILIHVG